MMWWAVAMAVAAAVPAPPTPTPTVTATDAATDAFGCAERVFDPSGELDLLEVAPRAEVTASVLGADLHIRAERSLDAGLDTRMGQLVAACPGWSDGAGDLAPDLVVILYSSIEREAGVYYGADQGFQLEARWEPATDAMIDRLRADDPSGGVLEAMDVLRQPVASPPVDDDGDGDGDGGGSSGGLPGLAWLGIVGVVVLLGYNVVRYLQTGRWGTGDGDDDGGEWGSSAARRRSFGGFGGSSRSSRRSSSAASRGSRGSRRSGGGSKKF